MVCIEWLSKIHLYKYFLPQAKDRVFKKDYFNQGGAKSICGGWGFCDLDRVGCGFATAQQDKP
jgi:hypothetical protein